MDPTDQPPPTPQTWAETSAWGPAADPTSAPGEAPAPATWTPVPGALHQPPSADDYVRPSVGAVPGRAAGPVRTSRDWSGARWMVIWAVIAEIVIIALGCNQWATKKVFDYTGLAPKTGFAHQLVYSTQTYAWRLTKATGESTSQWTASLVTIVVVLALSAALIALLVRAGSFWRATIATVLIVVFSTQVAAVVGGLVYDGPHYIPLSDLAPDSGVTSYQSTLAGLGTVGGGRATIALFDTPTGYRFVGGVMLGVLVGIVVGIVARRRGDDEPAQAAQWPSHTFFPPGEMQRSYEASTSAPPMLAPPGSFAPKTDDEESGSGRHSRE